MITSHIKARSESKVLENKFFDEIGNAVLETAMCIE